MRLFCALLASAAFLGLTAPAAFAANFDGKWVADMPAQAPCHVAIMTVIVSGHDLAVHVQNVGSPGEFQGTVDDSGQGTFGVGTNIVGTLQFSGNRFDATWHNKTCTRRAQGDRAPDENQTTQTAADRKRHQEAYADLVKHALAGDKIDYTSLRAEAVYAENWDFYNPKSTPLVQQADASAKGKDCPAALSKLDLALKYDFIDDAAHDLRADCLKQTGDKEQAAIERKIADGLVHSLMDSGNGKTERTAYVVSSQREENDVLANRHLHLNTRQAEVRGSDGRYYDVVKGIAISGSGLGVSTDVETVYFDISSFVAGRTSHRAAVETQQAMIH